MIRTKTLRSILTSVSLLSCVALSGVARADLYKLTDLGTFMPFDINSYGQMAGNTQTGTIPNFQFTAAFWTPTSPNSDIGTLTTLNARHLGGINNYGQVVGVTQPGADGYGTAFLWTPSTPNGLTGTTIELGGSVDPYRNVSGLNSMGQVAFPIWDTISSSYTTYLWSPTSANATTGSSVPVGAFYSEALNDFGQICGWTYDPGYNAMLWTPSSPNGTSGNLVPLGVFGGSYADTRDINSKGQVVGASDDEDLTAIAYLWNPTTPNSSTGVMSNLALGSTIATIANGIDEKGIVYGALLGSQYSALMFRNGQVIDLNSTVTLPPTYRLAQAIDGNEKGQIIGVMAVGTEGHGFLLTPKTISEQVVDVRALVTNLVNIGALLPANGQSLYSKLDAAKAKIAAGNKAGAITDLKAFINQVTTFVKTGKLSSAQGQTLINAANALIVQLSA